MSRGRPPGPPPKCHPERAHASKGLCATCYQRRYGREKVFGRAGRTVAEALALKGARLWTQPCRHLRRMHEALGLCRSCYNRQMGAKRLKKRKPLTLEQWAELVASRMERWEARPSKLYVPYSPKSIPVGGWDLGWLWQGNGIEVGLPKRRKIQRDKIPGMRGKRGKALPTLGAFEERRDPIAAMELPQSRLKRRKRWQHPRGWESVGTSVE